MNDLFRLNRNDALDRNRLLNDRRRQESRDDQGLTRLEESAVEIRIGVADRFAQFTGRQVRRLGQIVPRNQRNTVSALGHIQRAPRRRYRQDQRRFRSFRHPWSGRPRGT